MRGKSERRDQEKVSESEWRVQVERARGGDREERSIKMRGREERT
jgi:hypothetical protein